jgi:hypothetical protein
MSLRANASLQRCSKMNNYPAQSSVQWGQGYQQNAKNILAQNGNTAGFPTQFSDYGPRNTPETLNVEINNPPSILQAAWWHQPRYDSMVPDLPFDEEKEKRQQDYLLAFGLGFLLVGMVLWASR